VVLESANDVTEYQLRNGECRRGVDDDGQRGVGGGGGGGDDPTRVLATRTAPQRGAETLEPAVAGGATGRAGAARRRRAEVGRGGRVVVGELAQDAAVAGPAVTEEVVGKDVDAQGVVETGRHRRAARSAPQLTVTSAELLRAPTRVAVHEVHATSACTCQSHSIQFNSTNHIPSTGRLSVALCVHIAMYSTVV